MTQEKIKENSAFLKLLRFIVKDTGFDPDLKK